MIPGNREHSRSGTVTGKNNNISMAFLMKKITKDVTRKLEECPKDVQRMTRGCPEDVQKMSRGFPEDILRMPEGILRGPKDLQRIDWGCIDNAYIGMSRNHNDSDLRCCCADRWYQETGNNHTVEKNTRWCPEAFKGWLPEDDVQRIMSKGCYAGTVRALCRHCVGPVRALRSCIVLISPVFIHWCRNRYE